MKKLTLERAQQVLSYDAESGLIRRNGKVVGGRMTLGYLQFSVDGEHQYAHRVAWLLMTGRWPTGQIDHINGDRSDNRRCNLRDVDQSTNMQNMRSAPAGAKSGVLGASPSYGRYRACISVDGKFVHIGRFDTAEEAHAAYVSAKRKYHGGCAI
jgi:hypothetical protein